MNPTQIVVHDERHRYQVGEFVEGAQHIEALRREGAVLLPCERDLYFDRNYANTGMVLRHYGEGIEFTRGQAEPTLPLAIQCVYGEARFIYWAFGVIALADDAYCTAQVAADPAMGGIGSIRTEKTPTYDPEYSRLGSRFVQALYGKSVISAERGSHAQLHMKLKVNGTGCKLLWTAVSQSVQDYEVR